MLVFFFFSSRRRHTRFDCDWSSDVCSSDLNDFRVIVGYGEVIDGQIVVRGAADGYRPAAHGNLFHDFVVKHEAELRHLNFLQRYHLNLDSCLTHDATTKTIPWRPFLAARPLPRCCPGRRAHWRVQRAFPTPVWGRSPPGAFPRFRAP